MELENTQQQKTSLYMVVKPNFEVEYIRKFQSGWLFSFLEQETWHHRFPHNRDVPDNWMIEIRFNDEIQIPALAEENNSRYFMDQIMSLNEFATLPIQSIRLRDAVFCDRNGIDLLNSNYELNILAKQRPRLCTSGTDADKLVLDKNYDFPCWTALESERGMLLFSDGENGMLAERKYRQYIVDHFFDPKFNIEFLNVHQVPKFLTHLADYVDLFYDLRIKRAKEREEITPIPQSFFAPSDQVRAGFCQARFNLIPTGENFLKFARGMKVPLESCKLATLMNMVENATYETVRPEHNQKCPYEREYEGLDLEPFGIEQSFEEYKEDIRRFGKQKLDDEFPGDFRGKEMVFLKEETPQKSLKFK